MPHCIDELETPTAIVDLDRMSRNLDRAATYAKQHHLALRPHIKTHKSPFLAREQVKRGAIGLTCATPHEAVLMSGTTDDLLVAYPPVGDARLRHLMKVPKEAKLTVALDSFAALEALTTAARAATRDVHVLVELDLGMHRVGTANVDDAVALVQGVRARPPLRYAGIAFYPGHVRESVDRQDEQLAALRAGIRQALEALDAAGVAPDVVSGGSTPTMWRTHELPGVTEFRPGTYIFNDRTTAAIGACAWEDCALTVLATVVSTAVPGQAVIDAGSKALGREPLRADESGGGFGQLVEHPDVLVKSMSEEHGILDLRPSAWQPRIGERVRVIPNHVCIVVHLNDVVYGTRGDLVERSWPVAARGRGYPSVS